MKGEQSKRQINKWRVREEREREKRGADILKDKQTKGGTERREREKRGADILKDKETKGGTEKREADRPLG